MCALELNKPGSISPIYTLSGELYDHSRWLTLVKRGDGTCVMNLAALAEPNASYRLPAVSFPMDFLRTATLGGTFQINLPIGYLLLRKQAEKVALEFGAADGEHATSATFLVADLVSSMEPSVARESRVA